MDHLIKKIVKVLPHLNSDSDVNIVVAVRAIQRILKADGKSFHDFCDHLTRPALRPTSNNSGFRPQQKPPPNSPFKKKAEFIDQSDCYMSDWEKTFWADVRQRIYQYGRISEKQAIIVERLYERAKTDV